MLNKDGTEPKGRGPGTGRQQGDCNEGKFQERIEGHAKAA